MFKTNVQSARRISLVLTSVLLVIALLAVTLPLQRAGAVGLAVTCSTNHTVVSGETLSSIALKYNVTVQELAVANELKEPYQIFVGQILCIPGTASAATPSATQSASSGPDFTIETGTDPNTVAITTVRYPAKSPHFVRAYRTDQPTVSLKLGTIKTNKNGVASRVFRLPRALRSVPIRICLKNMLTDGVQCKAYSPGS